MANIDEILASDRLARERAAYFLQVAREHLERERLRRQGRKVRLLVVKGGRG